MVVQYSHSDFFQARRGPISYRGSATTTPPITIALVSNNHGAPLSLSIEDRGGILPVHTVGASASGLIPSGHLGLHYVAEVGNGRASRSRYSGTSAECG